MSFTPTFEITRILKDSSAIFLKDKTITGGTTGYGSTNAPASLAAITSLKVYVIPYGGDPIRATIAFGGIISMLSTELQYVIDIPDGVNIVQVLYGDLLTTGVTVSTDRLTLTVTNASTIFANVDQISLDGITLVPIKSINTNDILLEMALPGTATSATGIYRYYTAEVRTLVLYKANRSLINEINGVGLRINTGSLDKAMLKIILKEKAQSEYSLGNYAEADEAARLISGHQPVTSSTCNTCV